MALEKSQPQPSGETWTVARKSKIIVDTNPSGGTIDIELTLGNTIDGKFVPVSPYRSVWVKIIGPDFLKLAGGSFIGAPKTRWDDISDVLDAYVNAKGLV